MASKNTFLHEIGIRIMNRRKEMGLTQEGLAEKSDLTPQFISYAETGQRAMRPENLMKLANSLEVSTDYLLTGDIIDKDMLLISKKLNQLNSSQLRIVEDIIDSCIQLTNSEE